MVRSALREAFPENSGGFVGTLDNLELLDTSTSARRVLEELRDPVLQLPGMRWVLCGARGIARSLANTPRLNGVLSDPVDILPVQPEFIGSLIDARVQVFAVDEVGRANAPVDAEGFGYLYDVSNENLRDSLAYAQDFALGKDPAFFLDSESPDIEKELLQWIDDLAERSARDVRLQPRMWRLLEDLAHAGGTAAPGDHEQYGFNDRTHMRKNVVELERYDLAISSRDEVDGRRRSISLTSKGWLVHFAKKKDLLGQNAFDFSEGDGEG
jgi:DNA-binding MarR family transcriptional regulator